MRRLLLFVALAVLATASGAWAQNICPNPGMENSNATWMSGAFPDRWEKAIPGMIVNEVYVWEANGVGRAGRCISITNPATGTFPTGNARTSGVRWISPADGLVLDGSKLYDIGFWIKKTSDVKVRVSYVWYTGNKTTNVGTGASPYETATIGSWVRVVAPSVKPPLGAAYLEINVEIIPNTANTGTVYIDDAEVTAIASGQPSYGSVSGQVTFNGAGVANAIVGVKSTANALTDGQYYAVTNSTGNYTVTVPAPTAPTNYYAAAVKLPTTVVGETGYVAYSATADQTFSVSPTTPSAALNFQLLKPLSSRLQMRAAPTVSADPNDIWRTCDGINAGGDRWLVNATGAGDNVCMDLGAKIPVSLINVCQWSGQRAQDWTVDCSDDKATWTTIATATASTGGYANSSMWEIIRIPETSARYWRVTRNSTTTAQWVIAEFELYSEISGKVQGQVKAGGTAFNKAIVGLKYRRANSADTGSTLADADFYAITDASGNYSVDVSNGVFDVAAWPHQDTFTGNTFTEAWAPTVAAGQVTVNGDTQTANINCVEGLGPNPNLAKTTDTTLVTASGDLNNRMGVFNGNRTDTDWNPGNGAVYGTMASGAYITRDFGASPQPVDTIVLAWTNNRYNRQFSISYSNDNATWTPAYDATYSNGGFPAATLLSRNGTWEIIRLSTAVTARYWRITPLVKGGSATDWSGLHELELYKTTPPPGKISGTVRICGVPAANAYVAYKPASKGGYALADAEPASYMFTDANGNYSTPTMSAGNYIIAAWPTVYNGPPVGTAERYAMSDNVAVALNGDKTVDFNITREVGANVALTTDTEAVTASEVGAGAGLKLQPFNGARYGGDFWRVSTAPGWIQRDLGANPPAVDMIVLGTGRDTWAKSYKIESSTNGTDWVSQYDEPAANGGLVPPGFGWDRCEYIKLPALVTARYWKLTARTFNGSVWDLNEWEMYGSQEIIIIPASNSIAAAKGLNDGDEVSLINKTATASGNNVPTGCFYIEDSNRAAGIRVFSDTIPDTGSAVSVAGTMTTTPDGERAIQATVVKITATGSTIKPLGINNKGLTLDMTCGLLVKAWGTATSPDPGNGSFALNDGSDPTGTGIKVYSGATTMPGNGSFVDFEGVVGREANLPVIYVTKIRLLTGDITGDGWIKSWLYNGSYQVTNPGGDNYAWQAANLANDFLAADGGETGIQPFPGMTSNTKKWSTSTQLGGFDVDLNSIFPGTGNACTYAFVYLYSPEEYDGWSAQLRLGSDDGIRAWVNGEMVHSNDTADQAVEEDRDLVFTAMHQGWNTLLLKINNMGGSYGFCARVMVDDGTGTYVPLPGLKFSLYPQ